MLSFVTKESPIEPRTASFLDDVPRHRSPASPTLSHASILSPVPRLNSHPPASPLEPTPTAPPGYSPVAHLSSTSASPAAAGSRSVLFPADEPGGEPAQPRSLPLPHAGAPRSAGESGLEGGEGARAEAARAGGSPETPPSSGGAALGLYWPAPTTPRRAADGAGRLETLHEAEGAECSPELSPPSARVSSVIQWEDEDEDDGGAGPHVAFAALAALRASVAEEATRAEAYCATNGPLSGPGPGPGPPVPRTA